MKFNLALSSLLFIGMGCSEKEAFAPQEGNWGAGEMVTSSDTCGFDSDDEEGDDVEDEDSTMALTMVDETNFTLSDDETTYNCILTEQDFTCDETVETMDPTEGEYDAILTASMSQNGTFTSDNAGTVSLSYTMSCEGTDCETLGSMMELTMPCSMEGSAEIILEE